MTDRLFILPVGTMRMAHRWMVLGGDESIVELPLLCFLVELGDRKILIDTGCHPAVAADAESAWGADVVRHFKPQIGADDLVVPRLNGLGLEPSDITDVVLTHMHPDHAGCVQMFSHAPIWVQRTEYRWAMYPDAFGRGGYMHAEIKHPLDYRLLEGDAAIAEGLRVVNTPGHSPGHQSVLVRLPSGWTCLVGDAAYTRVMLDQDVMPGQAWRPEDVPVSASRIRTLSEAFAVRLIFSHDAADLATLPRTPDFVA